MNLAPFRPFSKRHETAIFEKRVRPSLSKRLRKRVWYILQRYDYGVTYQPDPNDRWIGQSTALNDLPQKLKELYGVDALGAYGADDKWVEGVNLEDFVNGAYPGQVLDVVELFCNGLPSEECAQFQLEINDMMQQERCPWLLCSGMFFQVDSQFLEEQALTQAHDLLNANRFEGALEEFRQARTDFTDGNYKGALINACKALESVLKTVEEKNDGTATARDLVAALKETDFYRDLPEELVRGFGDSVLMSVPFIRNKLGGHGQGSEIVEVPRSLAELELHLAGSLIVFIVKRQLELSDRTVGGEEGKEESAKEPEDEIPF